MQMEWSGKIGQITMAIEFLVEKFQFYALKLNQKQVF